MVLNPTGFLLHGIYNSDREYSILWPPLQRFYAVLEGICFVLWSSFVYIFGKGKTDGCLVLFLLYEDIHKFQNVLKWEPMV